MKAATQMDPDTGATQFVFEVDPGEFTLDMTEADRAVLATKPVSAGDLLRCLAVLVTAAERKAYLDAKTARPLLVLPNGGVRV